MGVGLPGTECLALQVSVCVENATSSIFLYQSLEVLPHRFPPPPPYKVMWPCIKHF